MTADVWSNELCLSLFPSWPYFLSMLMSQIVPLYVVACLLRQWRHLITFVDLLNLGMSA